MSVSITFRPIDTWSGRLRTSRNRSRFKIDYRALIDQISKELTHLGAKETIILVACAESQLREDGLLRSSAVPAHPGVVLYIPNSRQGRLRFQTDMYMKWQENLRAIADALEGLRVFDRHGVGKGGEQYRGYSALPPSAPIAAGEWSDVHSARRFLAGLTHLSVGAHPDYLYREAAKVAHPDVGGSAELMAKVSRARDFIRIAEGRAT